MLWRSKKNPILPSKETFETYARLIEKHAHKYPHGIPHYIRSLLWANARYCTLYKHMHTREHGQRLMRQRMAKAAHKAIKAKGEKLCAKALEGKRRKQEERKRLEAGVERVELRHGSSNLDGI